jgi:hypothetical protein
MTIKADKIQNLVGECHYNNKILYVSDAISEATFTPFVILIYKNCKTSLCYIEKMTFKITDIVDNHNGCLYSAVIYDIYDKMVENDKRLTINNIKDVMGYDSRLAHFKEVKKLKLDDARQNNMNRVENEYLEEYQNMVNLMRTEKIKSV